MKDPKRLLSGDGTGFERLLLDAARREQPSSALRRRMQNGLGIATSIFGIKAALAAAGQIAVVALLATGITDSAKNPASVLASRPAAAVTERAPDERVSGASVAAPAEPVRAPVAEPSAVAARASETAVTPASRAAPAARVTTPVLRDEIRLLDRARSALKQNAPRQALRELARYQERFPRGAFRQEASVLRVEALARSGQRARASALAQEFVAQHPDSPHVDRVGQVTSDQRRPARAAGAAPR